MSESLTTGVHHVGLSVSRLEESARFFVDLLGWKEVGRDPGYPSIFVSDGAVLVTLWQVEDPVAAAAFDRKRQIGLHHVAFAVESARALDEIHERVAGAPDVRVEFAPEPLRGGPTRHMICYEPSGVRVEFIWWSAD